MSSEPVDSRAEPAGSAGDPAPREGLRTLPACPSGLPGTAGASPTTAEPLLAFADVLLARREAEATGGPAEIRQFVTFFVRDQECGIPILQCREIVRVGAITRVPEAPEHVRGVVNLRGHIIPVVDTRRRLGLDPTIPTARSRLIVVEVVGRQLALLVDRVARILKLAATDVEPAPAPLWTGATGVGQVDGAKIQLLDAERLLCDDAPAGPSGKGQSE
jgi:purine-binding chemotaxis protein CheW